MYLLDLTRRVNTLQPSFYTQSSKKPRLYNRNCSKAAEPSGAVSLTEFNLLLNVRGVINPATHPTQRRFWCNLFFRDCIDFGVLFDELTYGVSIFSVPRVNAGFARAATAASLTYY